MPRSKIAIAIDESILDRLDELVEQSMFPSRSQAIQEAVEEKLARLGRTRLARECAKLDPSFEKALAEEGLSEELSEWPELGGEKSAGLSSPRREAESRRATVQYLFSAMTCSMNAPGP